MRRLLTMFVLCLLALVAQIAGDVFDECAGIAARKFIVSGKSCAHFIYCDGNDSYEGECPSDEDFFSADTEMCEPMGAVDCRLTNNAAATDASAPASVSTEAASASTAFPSQPIVTVRPAVITANNSATNGSVIAVAADVVTVVPTAAPVSTASTAAAASSGPSSTILATACPATDDAKQIVFLASTKSCSDYFVCYHGEPLAMHCAAMLHFNTKTNKCDHAENVRCLVCHNEHNITDLTSVRQQCQAHTVDLYPHSGNCNYFYLCRNGYLLLQQCPFFFGWDYEKRACVSQAKAKCYANSKRI